MLSELSSVKHLEISYKNRKAVYDFDVNESLDEKTFTLKSNNVGAIEDKDEIIKVNL